jgi:molecular chaperone DnaJ
VRIQGRRDRQLSFPSPPGAVMTVSGDYYGILGVPRDADTKAIKSAFRQLAHRCHPDVSTEPDAEQRFREIAEAYGVLSDPAKRARYDEQGAAGLAGASAEDLWGGIDFTDIFGSQAASFGNLFEQLFGWSPSDSRPWGDVRQDLTISLEEVMTGVDRVVAVRRPGPCPQCAGSGSRPGTIPLRCQHCDGTGRRTMASRQGSFLIGQVTTVCPECAGRGRIVVDPCPVCRARGWATRTEKITIRIPPGIPDGATLKLAGTGRPNTTPDQPTSDVYLSIHARTDPLFERVGADLWHDLHIHAADAALGVTAAVPLPGGNARVRVPPGTQPGTVLRVAGKGLPRYDQDGRGNLQLKVIVDIPRRLEPPQRLLYEQLQAADRGSTVDGSGSTAGDSPDPEVARTDRQSTTMSGSRNAASATLTLASVLLLLAGLAAVVGGIVATPSSWGSVMIMVGVVELMGAAAVWAGRRASRRGHHRPTESAARTPVGRPESKPRVP